MSPEYFNYNIFIGNSFRNQEIMSDLFGEKNLYLKCNSNIDTIKGRIKKKFTTFNMLFEKLKRSRKQIKSLLNNELINKYQSIG
ncbi:hypothetical protein BpHYR1_051431 [Brachionus plicatilis]|uniref:Uncharacterized protein n=1 Tax=Brachionus plicatilis TaxID=10195 RepID=A0A3M7SMB9_BRAPC|nr:hypothetical protein BpHYR1_051431 [Brachionus plicatilis]